MNWKRNRQANERLYEKAARIRDGKAIGLWLPILEHLACLQYPDAMVDLADHISFGDSLNSFGKQSQVFSAAWLYRRAYLNGSARAATNAASSYFNRNDMAGFRLWLRRAASLGDQESGVLLKRFELRQPHSFARKVRRLRPWPRNGKV